MFIWKILFFRKSQNLGPEFIGLSKIICYRFNMSQEICTVSEMVAAIYCEVPKTLHRAAGRSVLAHLIPLIEKGVVDCDGMPSEDNIFQMR